MRILITGATGLIGKEIGKKLVSEGHEIIVLVRDVENVSISLPFPAKALQWKNYDQSLPSSYFDNIDAVIHLAGEPIASGRWSKKKIKLILESRTVGTKNIVSAIKASNRSVKQFISASAIGLYGDGNEWVSEDSPAGSGLLSQVCQQWEKESHELTKIGINVINPRIGIVLSRNGGALEKMLPMFSLGIGGAIGNGLQWMSWIHQDDLCEMFLHFINNPQLSGAYNAVAPNPVSNKEFSNCLAKTLGRGLFLSVPSMVLKLGAGEMSSLVLEGQRVSAQKIMNQGFNFKFKDIAPAIKDLCGPLSFGHKVIFSEIWLPHKIQDVFSFFSNEKNLEQITPEYLNFKVLSKSTNTIQEGTLIDYQLKLHGFPMKWRTLIESWEPGKKFVDKQIKGPYKIWHHTHEFEAVAGGTLVRDRVVYKLPFGIIGELIAGAFVRADVTKIFSYRKKIISLTFK